MTVDEELLMAFPRRPAAVLFASKWKGKINSPVFYNGAHHENGVYQQNMDKPQIGGDIVFISLGDRVDAEGFFLGGFAPMRDCRLINPVGETPVK